MHILDGLTAHHYLVYNSVSGTADNNPFLLQCFTLIISVEILLALSAAYCVSALPIPYAGPYAYVRTVSQPIR